MDLSGGKSLQDAGRIIDAMRFFSSPPSPGGRDPSPTQAELDSSELGEAVAAARSIAPPPRQLFATDVDALETVALPGPARAADLARTAARAFVEGKLPRRAPTFDALQTTCLQRSTFLDLADARAPQYGEQAFHERIGALLGGLYNLEELGLRGLALGRAQALEVMPNFGAQLRALDLSNNPLGAGAAQLFADGAWAKLEVLGLSSTGLGDGFLAGLPADQLPALRVLHLRDNTFTARGLADGKLASLPRLRELSLRNCALRSEGRLLLQALQKLQLEWLNLKDNPISENLRYFSELHGLATQVFV